MTVQDNWAVIAAEEVPQGPGSILDGRTLVETPSGRVPAASLTAGDIAMTFDDGPRRLRAALRRAQEEAGRMILVPAGLIGNEEDMLLAPEQRVIVESDVAEALTGNPFAVLAASALMPLEGVRRTRAARTRQLVTLGFAEDQAVMVSGGAVLVTEAAQGVPCLLQERAGRYAPLAPGHVEPVVEALGEASWDARYAAMA